MQSSPRVNSVFDALAALIQKNLAGTPDHAEALHLLGVLAGQVNRRDVAVELIRRAIVVQPNNADYYGNLGKFLNDAGQVDQAVVCFQKAISLKPAFAEAHYNLGYAFHRKRLLNEAVGCYQKALTIKPDYLLAVSNLGAALYEMGKLDEAVGSFQRAVALHPEHAEAHYNLGNALFRKGLVDEAINCFRKVTALRPEYADAHYNLGSAYFRKGMVDDAIASFKQATLIKPEHAGAHYNLGSALYHVGRLAEAIASFQRALSIQPNFVDASNNLGNALKDQGKIDEALASFARVVELSPNSAALHSNLLYALHFSNADSAKLDAEHRKWAEAHARPLAATIRPHENDRSPDRRLRIGYLSPDFRRHSAQFFIAPILANHNPEHFEIFCYSNVSRPDEITEQLKSHRVQWRDVSGLSDEAAAKLIREDKIDVLVDLALHMVRNRMLVFARKPAPVQVTHIGYPASTGLPTMDYRITDNHLDPPGEPTWGTEEPIRLPHSFWCYEPDSEEPAVSELPALSGQGVTFGSLNNPCKVSSDAIKLWSRVLHAVPNSKMILQLADDAGTRQYVRQQFAASGIPSPRLQFVSHRPRPEYLAVYHRIDVALDPLPCPGHTTSCDAFWMGVPVVTLPGSTSVSRGGVSLANTLGLQELIAKTTEDYVKITVNLAADLPRLSKFRSELRPRMKASPLMDKFGYTRDLENAYREMWKRWAAGKPI